MVEFRTDTVWFGLGSNSDSPRTLLAHCQLVHSHGPPPTLLLASDIYILGPMFIGGPFPGRHTVPHSQKYSSGA